ncbi:MAG: FAD-binding protein [Desulfobacteraceae bacterium]|nr:FAD-binding protein [Desulfobacteraceae bacterium]
MKNYTSISDSLRAEIVAALDQGTVVTDPELLSDYNKDASELRFVPEMVVKPKTTREVAALVRLANEHHFPLTPRGGGSGLAGACLARFGGVVVSLEDMNRIRSIDTRNFIMEVEAGAISQDVRNAAGEKGLFYPPDPAGMDQSTIGGNAATDAGGPACVKYGTTRDYILGLEAVLPTGEIITTGVKTRKGVVGYDLTNLLVGAEGTLGIITALTLKLIPRVPAETCIMAVFHDMVTAMEAVSTVMARGHLPSAIEFMDHRCLDLVGEMLPMTLPKGKPSVLIIEIDGNKGRIQEEIQDIAGLCTTVGAFHIIPAPHDAGREKIWEVRRQVSLRIHDYAPLYISEDVAVPLSAIADLVNRLPGFESKYNLEIFAFGHAGDGNIHLNITARDRDNLPLVNQGVRAILQLVIDLGGTISGEHGIGIAKKEFIAMELSETSLTLQRGMKQLFDPNNILNPGKIFP